MANTWDAFIDSEWDAFTAIDWDNFSAGVVLLWDEFTADQWDTFTANEWLPFKGILASHVTANFDFNISWIVISDTFIWDGTTTSWNDGNNWENNYVSTPPVDGSVVIFNDLSVQDCTLDVNTAILGSLTFEAAYTGTIRPAGFDISVNNGDLVLNNNMDWVKGTGIITISGTGTQTLDIQGLDTETIYIDK